MVFLSPSMILFMRNPDWIVWTGQLMDTHHHTHHPLNMCFPLDVFKGKLLATAHQNPQSSWTRKWSTFTLVMISRGSDWLTLLPLARWRGMKYPSISGFLSLRQSLKWWNISTKGLLSLAISIQWEEGCRIRIRILNWQSSNQESDQLSKSHFSFPISGREGRRGLWC